MLTQQHNVMTQKIFHIQQNCHESPKSAVYPNLLKKKSVNYSSYNTKIIFSMLSQQCSENVHSPQMWHCVTEWLASFWDNMIVSSSSWHFDPWKWKHHAVSKHCVVVPMWCNMTSQKNRDPEKKLFNLWKE